MLENVAFTNRLESLKQISEDEALSLTIVSGKFSSEMNLVDNLSENRAREPLPFRKLIV
jgi:hypothetical protein